MRRAAKVDENQKEIIDLLRRLGFSVKDTSRVGEGFPDIVFARAGVNYLAEIKDGKKIPSKRRLTQDQERFHNDWNGRIYLFESEADVLVAIDEINGKMGPPR